MFCGCKSSLLFIGLFGCCFLFTVYVGLSFRNTIDLWLQVVFVVVH